MKYLVALLLLATPNVALASHTVLSDKELRIDFAPTGFTILDTGSIGGRRGIVITGEQGGGGAGVALGLGATYGISGRAEFGVLFLPLVLEPGGDFGDITTHLRYRLLQGSFELAVQAAFRIPTQTTFGVGLGAPIIIHLDRLEVQTGAELEIEDAAGDETGVIANLDIPATFLFTVTGNFVAGVRTGLFLADLDRVDIPLGGVAGARIRVNNGLMLSPVAQFTFDRFITGGGDGPFLLAVWTLQVGVSANLRL